VCGVSTEENAVVAKSVSDHAATSPVFLSEYFELEGGIDTQYLPDTKIAIEGCQILARGAPVVNEPSFAAIDGEQIAAAA
jgi:hypothetical protein